MILDPKPKPVQSIFHSGDFVYDSLESLRRHFDFGSVRSFFGGPFFKWVRRQDPVLADRLEQLPKEEARKLEIIKLFFAPGADWVRSNLDLVVYWLQNDFGDNARNYLHLLSDDDFFELVHQVGGGRLFSEVTGVPEEQLTFTDLLANPEASSKLPDLIKIAVWGDEVCSEILLKGTERLRKKEELSKSALFYLYELILDYRVDARIRPEDYPEIAEVARFFSTVISIRHALEDEENSDRWKAELVNADRCAATGGPLVRDFYTAFLIAAARSKTRGYLESFGDVGDLTVLPRIISGGFVEVLDGIRHPKLRKDCLERDASPQALSQMLDDYCRNYLNWLLDV
jgi:hypothetical protein